MDWQRMAVIAEGGNAESGGLLQATNGWQHVSLKNSCKG
jgi:hypothetical protein